MSLTLYSYFRSSASFRVRICLHLKNLSYQIRAVNLLKDGGKQYKSGYQSVNPQMLVPVLETADQTICQSNAIIEYLDEIEPEPALLPDSAESKAYVRSLASLVGCDIHPLNNLRVLNYLQNEMALLQSQKTDWYQHWIQLGFTAMEQILQKQGCNARYCYGNLPGLADIFLIPQVYNALRYHCEMEPYPLILSIYQHCMTLPAFIKASPEEQIDNRN